MENTNIINNDKEDNNQTLQYGERISNILKEYTITNACPAKVINIR